MLDVDSVLQINIFLRKNGYIKFILNILNTSKNILKKPNLEADPTNWLLCCELYLLDAQPKNDPMIKYAIEILA